MINPIYKNIQGQDVVHSMMIRDGVFEVEGIIIEAPDHYEAVKIYMEKYKHDKKL